MTSHKLFVANALCMVCMVCMVGCTASRTQMTSQIHRPLQSSGTMGNVAVVSVVSADKSRSQHLKRAAKARKSLQESLRKNIAVHDIVESLELPPLYGADRNNVDSTALLRQAYDHLRDKSVDTICLLQLRDMTGQVNLGFAIPPQQLVSIRGKCDYQLQLFDVRTGQELFSSTGTWSERTDAPTWLHMPSESHFGEQVAQVISPGTRYATSAELVARRPVSPARVAASTHD